MTRMDAYVTPTNGIDYGCHMKTSLLTHGDLFALTYQINITLY